MADLPPTLLPATLAVEDESQPSPPKAAPPLEYHLTHVTNPARTVSFTGSTDVTIGRDGGCCTLSFPEVAVLSRRHCRVFTLGRDVFVHDFSSNGTYLNGKVVGKDNKRVMRTGDVLAVVNPKLPEYNSFSWRFIAPAAEDEPAADDSGINAIYDMGKVLGTGKLQSERGAQRRDDGCDEG